MSNLYLLVFYTEGFPNDFGYDLTKSASEIKTFLSPFFKEIFLFSPRELKNLEGSENFCNYIEGEFALNPNLNHVGCGDFKSFLIDYFLKRIPENSILIYHDGNFEKYPQYWQTDWENLESVCNYLIDENGGNFFSPFESLMESGELPKVKLHGKRFTTEAIIENEFEREIIIDCFEIASSRMIIRNNDVSRRFFSEYKSICERKELLSKWPNPNPYPEFTHSCPEQHIYNLLIYYYVLRGILPPSFPKFILPSRRLRLNGELKTISNERLENYLLEVGIKEDKKDTNDNDIRGTQEFREDIFVI